MSYFTIVAVLLLKSFSTFFNWKRAQEVKLVSKSLKGVRELKTLTGETDAGLHDDDLIEDN